MSRVIGGTRTAPRRVAASRGADRSRPPAGDIAGRPKGASIIAITSGPIARA
ncbi:MAG TPA: hypothetical protein VGY48_11275 [Vicinamibacterales bacterium]|nr:hypothetical protein [Vicinamibacterales bacterium]